jgi:hypothetical protein
MGPTLLVLLEIAALYGACALLIGMYRKRERPNEPVLVVIRTVRLTVTVGAILFLSISYGIDTDIGRGYQVGVVKYVIGLMATAPVLVILGLLLVFLSPPEQRGQTLRRFLTGTRGAGPITVLLATGASFALAYYVGAARPWDLDSSRFEILAVLLALIFVVPYAFLTVIGPALAVASMFNAGAAHPLLPALAGPWFALAAVLIDDLVHIYPVDNHLINTPDNLERLLSYAAMVGLFALSAFEYWYLTRRHGVTLRSGPHRPNWRSRVR